MRLDLPRPIRAALALPELWVVLALVLALAKLQELVPPEYKASLAWTIHPYQVFAVCVALAWFILPGALLIRLLGVGGSWLTRLPTYFVTAVGLWSVPTLWVASASKYNIEFLIRLGTIMVVILAVAAYIRELWRPSLPNAPLDEGRTDLEHQQNPLLVLLVIVALIAAVYLSFNAPVAVDDNLQVMYVQDNLVVPRINEFEPVFGAGIRPHTRGSLTTWPLNLTVMTYITGLPALQAFWLLRTPLVFLNLLAIYALSLQLFGKRNLALLSVLFYFLLSLIYTNDAEAIGYGLFARCAQDKFVARYTMLPMALAWSIAYLKRPSYRTYWVAGICTIGISTTHPIGVILLAIPLGGIGFMHLFNHLRFGNLSQIRQPKKWIRATIKQNWLVIKSLVFLSIFSLVGVILPLLQQASPDAPIVAYSLTDTRDPTLWYRVNMALNSHRLYIADYLGPGAYIVHPDVFLDVYILLPAIGLPVLFFLGRKRWESELIIGTFLLNPAILLIPPIIQLIGSRATPWMLYRLAWPLSLLGPLTIVWAVWTLLDVFRQKVPVKYLHSALPPLILVVTAILLNNAIDRGLTILSEQRTDSFSSRCRTLQPLFSKLSDLVGDGTVVLSTPENNLCLVSSAAYAYPVEFGLTTTINRFPASREGEAFQRMDDVLDFTFHRVVDQDLMDILTKWNVGLILLRADNELVSQLEGMPQFFRLELAETRYVVYRVLPGNGTDILPEMPVKDRWKVARWEGDDSLITANTFWSEAQWGNAIAVYEATSQASDDPGPLNLIGLGRAYLSAGRLDDALKVFTEATEKYPDSAQAWMMVGNTRMIISDYEGMTQAYQRVLELIDWHPEALSRLADSYRFQGKKEEAQTYYQRAVSIDVTPGNSLYYRTLGSTYLTVNWTSEAITALEKSLAIKESLLGYSLLSQAYINLDNLEEAKDLAARAKQLDYWSDTQNIILGRIDLKRLDFAGAVENFRYAVTNNPQSIAVQYLASILGDVQGNQTALDEVSDLIGYKLDFAESVLAEARVQFSLGMLEEAIDSGERALEWKPLDSRVAEFLGNVYYSMGSWDQADDYYRTALTLNPFDQAAYVGLISLAQMEGQNESALGWGWTSLMVSPYNPDTRIVVGMISEIQGEIDQAQDNYQLATKIGPFATRPYVSLGNFQSSQGQFDSAIQSFNIAIEVQPDATSAYRGLAKVNQDLGSFLEAQQQANRAVYIHPAEGENLVAEAQLLSQGGDYLGAIDTLQQSILLDPGYREAYMSLGALYTRLGMISQAEAIYMQLIQSMPLFEEGYIGLGKLYERMGNNDKAIAIYQSALNQIAPQISGNVLLVMAEVMRRQGSFDRALELYQACIDRQPMLATGYLALSGFYVTRGDLALAREVLEQGVTLMPTAAELNDALAKSQILQGEIELAHETYQQAISIAPDPELAIGHAQLIASQGQPDLALAEVEAARKRWPGDISILDKGIAMAINAGQPDEALRMAIELVTIAPGYGSSWTTLGEAYAAKAQFNLAETAFWKATEIQPGNSEAELALARFLDLRGESDLAMQALARAMGADQTDVAPHLLLARILIKQGDKQAAIQELQVAADQDKSQNSALLAMGQIRQQEGNFAEAQRYFTEANKISPLVPAVYNAQAQTYLMQGRSEAARQSLITATQVSSGDCRTFLNLANYQLKQGEYSEAQQAYQQILQKSGCQADAHIGLGLFHLVMAQNEQATTEFLRAIEVEPGNAWGYIAAAWTFSRQARLSDAEITYQNGIEALPASSLLRIAYTRSLIKDGKFQEGLLSAEESVRLAPGSASYLMLGDAYQAMGQYERAELSFIESSKFDQSASMPFLNLGNLSARLAQFDQAKSNYRRAIELAPTDSQAYIALSKLLLARGQIDEASRVIEQGIAANQANNQVLITKIRYYLQVGEFDEAADTISRSFNLSSSDDLPFLEGDSYLEVDNIEPGVATLGIVLGDLYRLQANWAESEAAYRYVINTVPGFVNAYISLGKVYQDQGKYSEAREQFEQAIAVAPGSSVAYVALGDLEAIQADFLAAEASFQQAIVASPGQEQAYLHLGQLYLSQGRSSKAREQFEAATRIAPTSPGVWVALGDWFSAQADPENAQQAYRRAIDVGPANQVGFLALGNYYQSRGQRGEALAEFQRAKVIAPLSASAYLALANWYQREANWDAAEEWFRKAREADAGNISGLLGLGYLYLAKDQPREALLNFQAAQTLIPSDSRTYLALGDWYRSNINLEDTREMAHAEIENALELFRQANKKQEQSEYIDFIEYLVYGIQYQSQGETEEAYANFQAAIAIDPDSILPYLAMGEMYQIILGLPNAEQAYNSAIELAPGDIAGILRLGQLYLETGRNWLALEQFEKAVQIAPGLAQPHIALADWHRVYGEWQIAETEYQTAILVEPGNIYPYIKLAELYQAQGKHEAAISQYEMASKVGLPDEISVCGPGRLPASPLESEKVDVFIKNGVLAGSWRCQWDHRPWYLLIDTP